MNNFPWVSQFGNFWKKTGKRRLFKKQVPRRYNDASSSVFSNWYFRTGIFELVFSNWYFLLGRFKHFYWDFWSGFTMIYGEKYSFLSLFTKALRTNRRTDQPTDGRTNRRTDRASFRDARTHLKSVYRRTGCIGICKLVETKCLCVSPGSSPMFRFTDALMNLGKCGALSSANV